MSWGGIVFPCPNPPTSWERLRRWSQVAYAEMAGVANEAEAAARMSAAVGLPSYPTSVDETLRICGWLKSRPASAGFLGMTCTLAQTEHAWFLM